MTQEELNTILDSLDNKAYSMIRNYLYRKANSFAPNIKALHLHIACNNLTSVIVELEPDYFKD